MEDINREETPEEIDSLVSSTDWFPYIENWSNRTPEEMMKNLVSSAYGNCEKPFFKNIPMLKSSFSRSNFKVSIPDKMRFPVSFLKNSGEGGYVILTHDVDLKDLREMNGVGDFFMEDVRLRTSKRKFMKLTPLEIWDADKEKIVALARIKYGKYAGVYEIRNTLFSYAKESNPFRPSIALAIYAMFNPKNILDMSSGWGDRLLGAIAWSLKNPNCVIRYQGYDPFADLHSRYRSMIEKFAPITFVADIACAPFESALVERETFDLAFTSPPYFDLEEYGHSGVGGCGDLSHPAIGRDTQSTVRYPELSDWIDGFLKPTLRRAALSLRVGGFLALNIEGSFVYKILEKSAHDKYLFGNSCMRMDYQGIIGYKSDDPNDTPIHPIFIWRRIL